MLAEARFHLAGVRESAHLVFGEDQLAVDAHLEDSSGSLDQVRTLPEPSLNLVRQTGGTWPVVSDYAVFNCDRHIAG